MLNEESMYLRALKWKENKAKAKDDYPFYLPAIQQLDKLIFHPNVTFIVGENGMGKSTLIEAIALAYGFNPEGGNLNFHFSSYDSHSSLHEYIRTVKSAYRPKDPFFLRAKSFYQVASEIERLDAAGGGKRIIDTFGGKSLHAQSHGEAFFSLFNEKLTGEGLYIFDEPEAALSPLRQMALLARMDELVQRNSQFIIATHSPILMAYPHAKVIEIDQEGLTEKSYQETGHFHYMQEFFSDPERFIYHLLAER